MRILSPALALVAAVAMLVAAPAFADDVKIDELVVASVIPDGQRDATLKAVRAFYDFWNSGDEAFLKQAIADNFRRIVTRHYFDTHGRVGRSEFWYFALACLVLAIAAGILTNLTFLPLNAMLGLALLLPMAGMGARRLHDTGRDGRLVWAMLGPVAVFQLLAILTWGPFGWLGFVAFFAVDRTQGFIFMEDLGARAYLPALDDATADALYADALDALLRMQARVDPVGLPVFDEAFVTMELEIMPEWFLRRHLGHEIACEEWDVVELAFLRLVDAVRKQPQTFMHRDYHSRNLMVCDSGAIVSRHGGDADSMRANPGIIDFQGAVLGPLTYDLASLLRDCYIEWPAERVEGWLQGHRERLVRAGALDSRADAATFRRWFDLAGLQRHIKVLGIFCRLCYRDGKTQYLADLPLVWRYVMRVARAYPDLAPLADLLERALGERDITRPREVAA